MNQHDEILEAVLLGDRSRDDAEVREHLEQCAECRQQLKELDQLGDGLETAAVEEREVLAEASAADQEVTSGFAALLDAHRVHEVPGAGRMNRFARMVAVAAAVLLAVFAWQWLDTDPKVPIDDNPFLGGEPVDGEGEIELVEPIELPTLSWRFDLPEAGWYVLEIVDDTEVGKGDIVVPRTIIKANEWSPSDSLTPVELPAAFVLSIEAFDARNVHLATFEVLLPR